MCTRVSCSTCGRPTFAGCGNHVEQVLGDVPADERCQCGSGGAPRTGSWFSALRRRR
jgi:hypothetical protein